jgi:endonuclease/exonuclease/phosphatase family metal-dependent hydrolase
MRLRVLSLNVWGLPPPVGRFVDERMELVADQLPALDCDVALFQEVWTEGTRERLRQGGRAAGLDHHFWPTGPASSRGGLLALSRLPIARPEYRPYTLCGLPQRLTQMDYWSGKGVCAFELRIDGAAVWIGNTHLHARYAPNDVEDDYIGHRSAEIIELASTLGPVRSPVVVAGDFNLREQAPEYRLLQLLTGLRDVAADLGAREATSTLDNVWRRQRGATSESRIDYVFSRSGADLGVKPTDVRRVFDTPVRVAGRPGSYSDHAGVLADFEIAGAGEAGHRIPPEALELARELLDNGRFRARRRQRDERLLAGAGLGTAAAFELGRRRLTRRRFLRAAMAGGTGAALASSAGITLLSEHSVPRELAGFDAVEALLETLEHDALAAVSMPRHRSLSLR